MWHLVAVTEADVAAGHVATTDPNGVLHHVPVPLGTSAGESIAVPSVPARTTTVVELTEEDVAGGHGKGNFDGLKVVSAGAAKNWQLQQSLK